MALDTTTPNSPGWWLKRLEKRLADRRPTIEKYDRYYRGDHDLKFASTKFQTAFGLMFCNSSDNWMPLIVDAVGERLKVEGFRLGKKAEGDSRAWDIWQDNNLDAESDVLHTEALIAGEAYTLTWPNRDGQPQITVEHPLQMIVATDPADRRTRLAALKMWLDDDSYPMATVYLPDYIYKYRGLRRSETWGSSRVSWVEREEAGEEWPLPNPLGKVPVVPFCNRRRMLAPPTSELANATDIQDKINKLTFDMMVASEFAAFRQRWATGLEVPKDPVSGLPVEPFKSAIDRLWIGNDEAQFGEFEATDLKNYVGAVEMQVQHLAAQTRTPPHYLLGQSGAFPSGESLKATETGLLAKVGRHERGYGEGYEETMSIALSIAGVKPRGGTARMETIWADTESRSESEHVDSIMKKLSLGVPLRQLWEDLGYSQEQIERFGSMLLEEADLCRSSRHRIHARRQRPAT